MANTDNDTIAAISTPVGEGGISIIRVSGDDAIAVAQKIYRGKDLSKVHTNTINYGHIIDPDNGEEVDEVMVSVMWLKLIAMVGCLQRTGSFSWY